MNKPIAEIDYTEYLLAHGLKPNANRILVLRDLYQNRVHSNADEILERLQKVTKIARRTVFYVLSEFEKSGLVTVFSVDGTGKHYDFDKHPHAHFLCTECGHIFDAPMPRIDRIDLPHAFEQTEIQLVIKGICPHCTSKRTHN